MNFYFPEFNSDQMAELVRYLELLGVDVQPGCPGNDNLIAFEDSEDCDEEELAAFALPACEEEGDRWYYVNNRFLNPYEYELYESQRTQDANTRELERGQRIGALYGMPELRPEEVLREPGDGYVSVSQSDLRDEWEVAARTEIAEQYRRFFDEHSRWLRDHTPFQNWVVENTSSGTGTDTS